MSPTKKKKHPMKMTTAEAAKHLFHPHVVKHVEAQTGKPVTRKRKKS